MSITCSSCGVRLFGAEIESGVCENCRDRAFRTADEPPPRPRHDEPVPRYGDQPRRDWEDEPSPYRLHQPPRGGWQTFRSGVQCLRAALILNLLTALGGIVFGVCASGAHSGSGDLLMVGQIGQGVASLIVGLLWLISLFQLCGVPSRTGLRPLAFAALASYLLLIAGVLLGVFLLFTQINSAGMRGNRGPFGPSGPGPEVFLLALGGCALLALTGYVCQFLLFSGAARQLGDRSLGGQFITYLVLSILVPLVMYGLLALMIFGVWARPRSGSGPSSSDMQFMALVGIACMALVMLGLFIWLLVMLGNLAALCERPRAQPSSFDY